MPKTLGIWEWRCPKRGDAQNAVTPPHGAGRREPWKRGCDYACLQISSNQWFYNVPRNKIGKHTQENIFLIKYQKSFVCLRKMCLMVWKRTFYGNVDLSTTCQCRQLKLNPLSTQINIYCLMTNQTPALLVQRELQWCYYSPSIFLTPPPLPPKKAIIPDARLLGTF